MKRLRGNIAAQTGLDPEIVAQIVGAIRAQVRVRRVILFGSRATGGFERASDIDIAYETVRGNRKRLFKSLVEDEVRTIRALDIVALKDAPARLRSEILEKGILLYESRRTA
jgi:predicted nucleotidyltransferase